MGGRWLNGYRPYLTLALFCLLLYLPGLVTIPPLDRDEARFAQASAQMLESGNFVDIHFQDQVRYKKPAGIYWLQAASVSLLSDVAARRIWAYRVPSLLGALAAVLLTFRLGGLLFDRRTAFLAAALLAASAALVLEAHQAKSDAVLLATVLAAQLALARIYLGARGHNDLEPAGPAWAALLWVALGLGILVKGPITPMVAALTAGALALAERKGRWLGGTRPLWGIPLMAAVAAPWFVAIALTSGATFFREAIGHDMLAKIGSAQESHGGFPGYYTLLATALFWPGSLYLWPALAHAVKQRAAPPIRFCLAWLVPGWLVFEAVATKLPHYVLPLFPALALLTAAAVTAAPGTLGRIWAKGLTIPWAVVGLVLAAAAVIAPLRWGDGFAVASLLPAAAAALAVGSGSFFAWTRRPAAAATCSVLLGAIALAGVLGIVIPQLKILKVSQRTHDLIVDRVGPVPGADIVAAGYHEPSLVFLLGTHIRLTDGLGAARFLEGAPGRVAVVNDREKGAFLKAWDDRTMKFEELGTVGGLNYSRGREAVIYVYRSVR